MGKFSTKPKIAFLGDFILNPRCSADVVCVFTYRMPRMYFNKQENKSSKIINLGKNKMRTLLFLLCTLIFPCAYASAQNLHADTVKAAFYLKEAESLLATTPLTQAQTDSAKSNYQKARKLYEVHKLWESWSNVTASIARIYYTHSKFTKISEFLNEETLLTAETYSPYAYFKMLNYLGVASRNQGDYNSAIKYYRKAITYLFQNQEQNTAQAASIFMNLGATYNDISQLDSTEFYYRKGVKLFRLHEGEESRRVAATYNSLGQLYLNMGRLSEAEEYLEKSIATFKQVMDDAHYELANVYEGIGNLRQTQGRVAQGLAYHKQALDIRLQRLGQNHPLLANSYNNIANAYSEQGDQEKALAEFQKGLSVLRENYGENHPYVGVFYLNIGMAYDAQKKHLKAKEYLEKSRENLISLLGEEHEYVALLYQNMSSNYAALDDYQQALFYGQKGKQLAEKLLGQEHIQVALMLSNLGTLKEGVNELDSALYFTQRGLEILSTEQNIAPFANPSPKSAIDKMLFTQLLIGKASILERQKKLDIALEAYGVAIESNLLAMREAKWEVDKIDIVDKGQDTLRKVAFLYFLRGR